MTVEDGQPSAAFARGIERTHPVVGPGWLLELPELRRRLARTWELKLTRWLPARGSYVTRALTRAGDDVVVKIPVIASDTASESAALGYWDGDGAAELLGVDAASGAMLVAWVDGRPFVEEVDGPDTLRRAGELLRDLHRPRPGGHPPLPTLEDKLAPWRRSRELAERSSSGVRIHDAIARREEAVRAWLAAGLDAGATTVIHGDLHPRNLLVRANGELCAIDPYGVIGDRARDAASLALVFREDGQALSRLDALAELAGLERTRVIAHAYVIAVGAYRFRLAYGITAGRAFLEATFRELEGELPAIGLRRERSSTPAGDAFALLWQGSMFDPTGYSEETRCVLYACESQRLPVVARQWPTFDLVVELGAAQRATLARALARDEPSPPYVEVLHKTIPPAARARLYTETGPTVLRTMFETDSLPEGWAAIVARFDRVWVPGAFNLESFRDAGVPEHKLRELPQTLDFATLLADRSALRLPDDARGTRFLSVFEFSERKGWRLLLDAWADAFGPHDDVSLVLKCSTLVMGVTDTRRRIDSYLGARRTAPIVVLEGCLSQTDMAALYHACDAFVLPSRGEGWGRPFMEAMAVGLPTIGPDWGGSREFMSPTNAFLVPGEVVPIEAGDLVFERYVGQRWFDPDRDALTSALRTVAGGGADVAARAQRGAQEIRERFSHERFVARLQELVADALGDASRASAPPACPSQSRGCSRPYAPRPARRSSDC